MHPSLTLKFLVLFLPKTNKTTKKSLSIHIDAFFFRFAFFVLWHIKLRRLSSAKGIFIEEQQG